LFLQECNASVEGNLRTWRWGDGMHRRGTEGNIWNFHKPDWYGLNVVVYSHFRVYNNGEEDGNTNTFRKCHRGD